MGPIPSGPGSNPVTPEAEPDEQLTGNGPMSWLGLGGGPMSTTGAGELPQAARRSSKPGGHRCNRIGQDDAEGEVATIGQRGFHRGTCGLLSGKSQEWRYLGASGSSTGLTEVN